MDESLALRSHAGGGDPLAQLRTGERAVIGEGSLDDLDSLLHGTRRQALLGQPRRAGGEPTGRGEGEQPVIVLAANEVKGAAVQPADDERPLIAESAIEIRHREAGAPGADRQAHAAGVLALHGEQAIHDGEGVHCGLAGQQLGGESLGDHAAASMRGSRLEYGPVMDFEGKVVVVTGASGGIGGAIVRGLIERGARSVVAADLQEAGVEGLAEELGARVVPRVLDVADEQATFALVAEIEATVGPIDVWFANAGLATGSGVEAPDEDWDRQWQINVMSHVYAARALLPGWVERGEGRLVTTASMAGVLTAVGDAAYSASKHAAVGFAEWLAFTYAGQGVGVSCVCPGAVDTAMLRAGGAGDAAKASAVIGGGDVMAPADAAERILEGVEQQRFLILTHPDMHEFVLGKAQDPDRWIRGMTKLWARAQSLLS